MAKKNILKKVKIDNWFYIILLLVLVLIICGTFIKMRNNIAEQFSNLKRNENFKKQLKEHFETSQEAVSREVQAEVAQMEQTVGSSGSNPNSSANDPTKGRTLTDDQIARLSEDTKQKVCESLGKDKFNSIVSKYSGKVISVEPLEKEKKGKRKYLIKWRPVGGKPGGCITANADGTFSTPICNNTISDQKWEIIEIKDEDSFRDYLEPHRESLGRPLSETAYPFFIVKSNDRYLNYEGGGLSVRELANYDGMKWDASNEKVAQDPLPTQDNNKFTGLTPGHLKTETDKSVSSLNMNGMNQKNGDGATNLNINLDPDLLAKLGLALNDSPENLNNEGDGDLLVSPEEFNERRNGTNSTGGRGNTEGMFSADANHPECKNCGKIPPQYIEKDFVEAVVPGCTGKALKKVKAL